MVPFILLLSLLHSIINHASYQQHNLSRLNQSTWSPVTPPHCSVPSPSSDLAQQRLSFSLLSSSPDNKPTDDFHKNCLIALALQQHNSEKTKIENNEHKAFKFLLTTFTQMRRSLIQHQQQTNWCNIQHEWTKQSNELNEYVTWLYQQRKDALEAYKGYPLDPTALCPITHEHFDTKTMHTVHPQPTRVAHIEFIKK